MAVQIEGDILYAEIKPAKETLNTAPYAGGSSDDDKVAQAGSVKQADALARSGCALVRLITVEQGIRRL